jgi:predicted TIM-barrel fold metal-dependent hydrolase
MSSEPRFIDVHCGWGATPTAPNWSDDAQIRATLKARGIGQAFLASRPARLFDPVEGNDALARVVIENGGDDVDLKGWLVVNPARLSDAIAQMRQYLLGDLGERFVGAALYPDPHTGRPVTARDAGDIVKVFLRYSRPLLIYTPNAAAMYETVNIAQTFSGVKIIASGMGCDEWRESVMLAAKPTNLMLDVSGALCPEKIDFAADALAGVRKLLFASGAPETDPAAVISMLFETELSAEDRGRILFGNAQRLFSLAEDETDDQIVLSAMSSLQP